MSNRMIRRVLLAAAAVLIASVALAGASADLQAALDARAAGDYVRALALLRSADPSEEDDRVQALLAETLAWNRNFDDAAGVYTRLLSRRPGTHDALLGLARVRLWQGRYRQARRLFQQLLASDPHDTAAAEGAATAAYWSGDFRTAARELPGIDTDFARRSLAEITTACQPTSRIDTDDLYDDQPFHSTRAAVSGSTFSDPLTRWDGIAGTYRLSSREGGTHGVPFASAGNETAVPAVRLTLGGSIGGIHLPDGTTRATGSASARMRLGGKSGIALSVSRRELLTNATTSYPMVRSVSVAWRNDGPWFSALTAEWLHYSDGNDGASYSAYVLEPVLRRGAWSLSAGISALYRDTSEQRFHLTGMSSTRIGSRYRYSYEGTYDPYWTPDALREGRAIVRVERRSGGTLMSVQVDGGRARDVAVGFWPEGGAAPLPAFIGSARFRRTFTPRRVRLSADLPLPGGALLQFGFEHAVTIYYEANSVHASVGRRF